MCGSFLFNFENIGFVPNVNLPQQALAWLKKVTPVVGLLTSDDFCSYPILPQLIYKEHFIDKQIYKSFLENFLANSLRYLVEDLAKREEVFQTRTLFATEQRKRYEELEVVVKSYTDKENLGNKVKLLQQRREWANVAELKEQVEVTRETPQKNRNFMLVAIKRESCKTVSHFHGRVNC